MANAFSSGVGAGGLHTTEEIKVLVLYVLSLAGIPFSAQSIINVAESGELANTFEVSNAVSAVCRDALAKRDENGLYTLTDKGSETLSQLKTMLNPFAREEAKRRTAKEVVVVRRLGENDVEITPEGGGYYVKISMKEQGSAILELRLRVGTLAEAQEVKERFLNDPAALYKENIRLLLGYEIN